MIFALSLDDFSPRPNTNDLTWANKLIERFPDIKIDLFVPAAYARLTDGEPYYLSKHLDWVKRAKQLPTNYRINLHGFKHRRTIKDAIFHKDWPASNNDEWQHLDEGQAREIGKKMLDEFKKAALPHTMIFRPCGWKLSTGSLLALGMLDIKYIAGSKEFYNIHKERMKSIGLKWISYNWDLLTEPPQGDIVAYGHTSNWTINYLNEERYNTIMKVLEKQKYEFKFIEEM